MIQVNVRSGEIPTSQGNAVTPPGTLLFVAASNIFGYIRISQPVNYVDTAVS
jgi:hypothetical protein